MLSNHSSPAVVSASAAGKLPRAALIALLAAFVLPLFFSTDVWSGKSLISVGVAWNMANGALADRLLPNGNGFPASDVGPLSFWFAALCVKVFGPLFGNGEAFHLSAGLTHVIMWLVMKFFPDSVDRQHFAKGYFLDLQNEP